jgi:hypothetical protein
MPPLVSILIPCHNAAPWLRATLESALAQTWTEKEIILVDDGSTDGSVAIAQTYAPAVQVLTQANRGASSARNHARRVARGALLQYLDADDLLTPDKIERQMELSARPGNQDCLISGEWARFYGDPATARAQPDRLWRDWDAVEWQICALTDNAMIHPAAWLVPKALSEAAGVWDETLTMNDDGEYFCRVRFAARRVLFCPGSRTLYRSGVPGSLSSTFSPRALDSEFRAQEKIQARLRQQEDSPRTRRACADGWMHTAFTAAARAPDLADRAFCRAQELGGSPLRPPGGRIFRGLARVFGWKRACQWRSRVQARGRT